MNQVSILCQNDNCIDQIIKRICQNKSCNKNRLICDRCLIDHKNHIEDCLLIIDIPQQINEILKQQKYAQIDTKTAIDSFLKKVRMQIEQKFAFQLCPIFSIEITPNILDWTSKDFYKFSQTLSSLDFESKYFDKALSEKINQLNSIQYDCKSHEQLFVPKLPQMRNKIITSGLSAKIDKNYGMKNFQAQILRENVFKSIEIRDNELISGSDMEKLSILTPNLLDLAQDQIKLAFKYEGNLFYKDGKNKFGLYTGVLNKCSLCEENNERNLILIDDQGNYVQNDIQLLEYDDVQSLFPQSDNNSYMLVFNKQIDNQSLSLLNLRVFIYVLFRTIKKQKFNQKANYYMLTFVLVYRVKQKFKQYDLLFQISKFYKPQQNYSKSQIIHLSQLKEIHQFNKNKAKVEIVLQDTNLFKPINRMKSQSFEKVCNQNSKLLKFLKILKQSHKSIIFESQNLLYRSSQVKQIVQTCRNPILKQIKTDSLLNSQYQNLIKDLDLQLKTNQREIKKGIKIIIVNSVSTSLNKSNQIFLLIQCNVQYSNSILLILSSADASQFLQIEEYIRCIYFSSSFTLQITNLRHLSIIINYCIFLQIEYTEENSVVIHHLIFHLSCIREYNLAKFTEIFYLFYQKS